MRISDYGPYLGVIIGAILAAIPGAYLGKKDLAPDTRG